MTETTPQPPPGTAADLGKRVFAGLVFIVAVALLYLVMRLPLAARADSVEPWLAKAPGQTLSVVLPRDEIGERRPVITLDGPPGQDVSADFESAALTAESRLELTTPQGEGPPTDPPRRWLSHAGGTDRAVIEISVEALGKAPALAFRPITRASVAGVKLSATDARLRLRLIASVSGGAAPSELVDAAGDALVRMEGDGAIPLEVVVPPGKTVTLTFPAGAIDAADFRLGGIAERDDPPTLKATVVRIQTAGDDRLRACGSPDNRVAWGAQVGLKGCRPDLLVSRLALSRDGVGLQVGGFAFLAEDGRPKVVLPVSDITGNPLVGLALGGGYVLLGSWVARTIFRRGKTPGARTD